MFNVPFLEKKDIDFDNLTDFVSKKKNRQALYDDQPLLSFLENEKDILYFINQVCDVDFKSSPLYLSFFQKISKEILLCINKNAIFFRINKVLTYENRFNSSVWNNLNDKEFKDILQYSKEHKNEEIFFNRDYFISLLPMLNMFKIRMVCNMFEITPEDFSAVMIKIRDNEKKDRYKVSVSEVSMGDMLLSAVWELEKRGFLVSFLEIFKINPYNFIQDGVALYICKNYAKETVPKISIEHFVKSSSSNFISLLNYIKNDFDRVYFDQIISDMVTVSNKYRTYDFDKIKDIDAKTRYLIIEVHNSKIAKQVFYKIQTEWFLESFININKNFSKNFNDYNFENIHDFNSKLFNSLIKNNVINWKKVQVSTLKKITTQIFYEGKNPYKMWSELNMEKVLFSFMENRQEDFLKILFSTSILNNVTLNFSHILNSFSEKYLKNKEKMIFDYISPESYNLLNDSSKEYISKIEKKIIKKSNSSLNKELYKRRI